MKKIKYFLFLLLISCSTFEVVEDTIPKKLITEKFNQNDNTDDKNSQPIKIVQISDLHIRKNKKIYNDLIEYINKIEADIIFLTGDIIDNKKNINIFDQYLERFEKNSIKFSILGNWERGKRIDLEILKNIYKKNGIELLINEGVYFQKNSINFYIYGLDDIIYGKPDFEKIELNENNLNFILIHCPQIYDILKEKFKEKEFYALSGHTHGGQVTFFGKAIYLPKGSGKYVKGFYKYEKSKMFVSKGIGNSTIDIRFFAKPDILLITIK